MTDSTMQQIASLIDESAHELGSDKYIKIMKMLKICHEEEQEQDVIIEVVVTVPDFNVAIEEEDSENTSEYTIKCGVKLKTFCLKVSRRNLSKWNEETCDVSKNTERFFTCFTSENIDTLTNAMQIRQEISFRNSSVILCQQDECFAIVSLKEM